MDKWKIFMQYNLYFMITFLKNVLYTLNNYMKLSTAISLFYNNIKKKIKMPTNC